MGRCFEAAAGRPRPPWSSQTALLGVAAALLLFTLPVGGPIIPFAATKLARALTPGTFGCWLSMVIPLGVGRRGHSLGRTDFLVAHHGLFTSPQ